MGHLKTTPSVTKTFSVDLNDNAALLCKKINGKAFLEKFPVKDSSILIGLENFGATEFLIIGWLGWYSH